jgi:hypothetical protein
MATNSPEGDFSRKISVFRRAGEVLVTFASLGFGVGDEHDNRERVEVMDISTGNSFLDLRQSFAENSESSFQNAVLTNRYGASFPGLPDSVGRVQRSPTETVRL